MISLEKLPKNVGDLSKVIVVKHQKKSPKGQKIAKSGHNGYSPNKRLFNITRNKH